MSIIWGDGAAVLMAEDQQHRESGSREPALSRLRQMRKKRRQHYQRIADDNPLVFQPRTPRLPIQPPPAPPAREVNASLMRFLFEKELRNSDVSIAGRIVVPKKLAEMHLPLLNEKEGLWMHLDDMDLQQVWTFKFRFWPNHRSRMYVFENAREFIKRHGLELGDCLMVFKDDQAESYVIRGRKKNDNSRAQTITNISNTNLPASEECSSSFHYAENHQYDYRDGATPDYEQLISTPCCESLDLFPTIE